MDDELRLHVELRAADLMRSGLTEAEAKHRARIEFGNPEAYQDRCREARRVNLVDDLRQDVRYALRSFRKSPALTLSTIATLTLAIGATTALFSVVNGVVLRPLPYPAPEQLAAIGNTGPESRVATVFGPDYVEWRSGCDACEHVAASAGVSPANIASSAGSERVSVAHVTENFFETFGVHPLVGRVFREDERGRPLFGAGQQTTPITAVILGHGLWLRLFGGDPGVIGRTLVVDGDPCTIVGIMPRGFDFPMEAEAWVPAAVNTKRDNAYLRVFARMREGKTIEETRTVIQTIATRIDRETGAPHGPSTILAVPLHEYVVGDVRSPLLVFLGAVGFVLVIACANVANLLLARAASRPREFAIRAALGAERSRIVRQLLTESVLLGAIGGALGLALAVGLVRIFVAIGPSDIPRLAAVGVDVEALAFTAAISLVAGILFGCAPVLRLRDGDRTRPLQDGDLRVAGSAAGNRLRKALIASEVALTLILLVGGGLLFRSFLHLLRTPTGINPESMLTASVSLPEASYRTMPAMTAYYEAALERLTRVSGIDSAGIVNALPLGANGARIFGDIGVQDAATKRPPYARKLTASGGYFKAVGIPLVKGRTFDDRDTATSQPVAIVSEALARRVWPGADPIGKKVNFNFPGESWREVVGVVGDVKHDGLSDRDMMPSIYGPYLQMTPRLRWLTSDMTFAVRTAGRPEDSIAALRTALGSVDPTLPVYDVALMRTVVSRHVTSPRFYLALLGSFALLALVLAAAGIYGVVAYSVTQRTREIGIRVALGATAGSVRRLVLREGMLPVVLGGALGAAGAFVLTKTIERFLFEVSVRDPLTFVAIPLLLVVVALAACALPALRATRIDPVVALREE
jgi:predicted permease